AIACSSGSAITIVDTDDSTRQTILPERDEVMHVQFSPDGKRLAVYTRGALHLWEPNEARLLLDAPRRLAAPIGAFSPDGSLFVFAEMESFKFLDLNTLQPAGELPAERGSWTKKLVFSGDSSTLAWFGDEDCRTVYVRKIERTGQGNVSSDGETVEYHHAGQVAAVALNRDGSVIASASLGARARTAANTTIFVWEADSARLLRKMSPDNSAVAKSFSPFSTMSRARTLPVDLKISPEGDELAVSTVASKVFFLDIQSSMADLLAKPLTIERLTPETALADGAKPDDVRAADSRRRIAASYDELDGYLGEIALPEYEADGRSARRSHRRLSFGGDGRTLRVYTGDEFLVYDLETRQLAHKLGFINTDTGLHKHMRLRWVAALSGQNDVAAFEANDGNAILVREGSSQPVILVVKKDERVRQDILGFSPDGDLLYTSTRGGRRRFVWNVKQGRLVKDIDDLTECYTVKLARKGSLLASAGGNVVSFLDAKTLKPHVTLEAPPNRKGAPPRFRLTAISEDGTVSAAACVWDVYVWMNASGLDRLKPEAEVKMVAETGPIFGLLLSRDGTLLLTGVDSTRLIGDSRENEAVVRIRDLQTDQLYAEIGDLNKDTRISINSLRVALSPDDSHLAVLVDGKVLLFDMNKLIPQ
ncbi:MAG: WD40 repeat domain-containing protein, partial [Planctomycetota bacterium]